MPCSKAGFTATTRPWQSVMAIKSLLCANTLAARRLSSRWRCSCTHERCTQYVSVPVTSSSASKATPAIQARVRVSLRQSASTSWREACDCTNQGSCARPEKPPARCHPAPLGATGRAHWRSSTSCRRACWASGIPGWSSSALEKQQGAVVGIDTVAQLRRHPVVDARLMK